MYPGEKRKQRIYVLNDDDRQRIDQLILTLRCAFDAILERREVDPERGPVGDTAFDEMVNDTLWQYLDSVRDPDPDF